MGASFWASEQHVFCRIALCMLSWYTCSLWWPQLSVFFFAVSSNLVICVFYVFRLCSYNKQWETHSIHKWLISLEFHVFDPQTRVCLRLCMSMYGLIRFSAACALKAIVVQWFSRSQVRSLRNTCFLFASIVIYIHVPMRSTFVYICMAFSHLFRGSEFYKGGPPPYR